MKKVLDNIRKFMVLALFILSICVIIGEHQNLMVMVVSKIIALTYFYLFLKANKVLEV